MHYFAFAFFGGGGEDFGASRSFCSCTAAGIVVCFWGMYGRLAGAN
jgi:hypothetical protein